MITYHVPSGIGDVSWMYSKLKHAPLANWRVADGWPARTAPYLKLLDNIAEVDYGDFTYSDLIKFEEYHNLGPSLSFNQVKSLPFTNVFLEANRHLEMGRPLETWMPDLPTDYHYKINIPDEDKRRAVALLDGLERPIWGISAASYRGSEAWKTWGYDQWKEFLTNWHALRGGTILMMGGFWDDLTHTLASEAGYKDIVGKTSVPTMVHVLDLIDGYIGFSSGMGIIRTVLKKPVFMLWPDHQVELSTSWAPPSMLENGQYVASLWRKPSEVFERAKVWGRNNYD